MSLLHFMNSTAGRITRIVAGVVLIAVGFAVVGGTAGAIVAIVGLLPIATGIGNICLLGPLMGRDLHGAAKGGGTA